MNFRLESGYLQDQRQWKPIDITLDSLTAEKAVSQPRNAQRPQEAEFTDVSASRADQWHQSVGQPSVIPLSASPGLAHDQRQHASSPEDAVALDSTPEGSAASGESLGNDFRGPESQFGGHSQAAHASLSQRTSLEGRPATSDSMPAHKAPREEQEGHSDKRKVPTVKNGSNHTGRELQPIGDPPGRRSSMEAASSGSGVVSNPVVDDAVTSSSNSLDSSGEHEVSQAAAQRSSSSQQVAEASTMGGRSGEQGIDAGTGLSSFADIQSSEFARYFLKQIRPVHWQQAS